MGNLVSQRSIFRIVAVRPALKVTTPGGKATFENIPAGTIFFALAEIHSAEVIGGMGTRSYIIELKGKDWKPSTGCAGNSASACA
jgi:hypothetical protein